MCAGTLDLNLLKMPFGKSTARNCSLDQLPKDDDGSAEKRQSSKLNFFNLFEKKRAKGWWPAKGEDCEGKEILAVSCCQRIH